MNNNSKIIIAIVGVLAGLGILLVVAGVLAWFLIFNHKSGPSNEIEFFQSYFENYEMTFNQRDITFNNETRQNYLANYTQAGVSQLVNREYTNRDKKLSLSPFKGTEGFEYSTEKPVKISYIGGFDYKVTVFEKLPPYDVTLATEFKVSIVKGKKGKFFIDSVEKQHNFNEENLRLGNKHTINKHLEYEEYVGSIGSSSVTLMVAPGMTHAYYYYNKRPSKLFPLEVIEAKEYSGYGFHYSDMIVHEYAPDGHHSGVLIGQFNQIDNTFKGRFINVKRFDEYNFDFYYL